MSAASCLHMLVHCLHYFCLHLLVLYIKASCCKRKSGWSMQGLAGTLLTTFPITYSTVLYSDTLKVGEAPQLRYWLT